MSISSLIPRLLETRVREALGDSPVALIHGPRQCGKTTLARSVGSSLGYTYISLDEDVLRDSAESDPTGFVADLPDRVVLDEVQRVPRLFTALELAADRQREPGRFLLTGSANVLFVPQLSDSLAGRMEILRLFPFAQCEMERSAPEFVERLFAGDFPLARGPRLGRELAARVAAGGYPPALARKTPQRRATWYREYVETHVQRDVRSLARIGSLETLPRLLELAASQTARLLNVSELAGPFKVSRPTIRDYVTLLEQVFLVEELPPWHSNRLSRLVKTPKLHVGDAGLAAALLGLDADALYEDRETYGQLLETFVLQELRRIASASARETRLYHYRDKDGYEVDVVLEQPGRGIAGVEVKASSTVTSSDFRGLRRLARSAGKSFKSGVVLFDGEIGARFGDGMHAVPIRALWETSGQAS